MTAPAAFYASVHRTSTVPGRKCFQIVLEGPIEDYMKALQVIGDLNPGHSTWLAIARLDPEKVQSAERTVVPDQPSCAEHKTAPASESLPAPVRAKIKTEKRLAQLAGMLAKTPLFHRYVEFFTSTPAITEEDAAAFIRTQCRIDSRSRIIPDTPAGDKFLKLYDDFIRWRDADQYVEA